MTNSKTSLSFEVDPGKRANEPALFLHHIQTGTCIIDMWNADSLFHEGSVTVKLKVLYNNTICRYRMVIMLVPGSPGFTYLAGYRLLSEESLISICFI